jgi:hypothetical protein
MSYTCKMANGDKIRDKIFGWGKSGNEIPLLVSAVCDVANLSR